MLFTRLGRAADDGRCICDEDAIRCLMAICTTDASTHPCRIHMATKYAPPTPIRHETPHCTLLYTADRTQNTVYLFTLLTCLALYMAATTAISSAISSDFSTSSGGSSALSSSASAISGTATFSATAENSATGVDERDGIAITFAGDSGIALSSAPAAFGDLGTAVAFSTCAARRFLLLKSSIRSS